MLLSVTELEVWEVRGHLHTGDPPALSPLSGFLVYLEFLLALVNIELASAECGQLLL